MNLIPYVIVESATTKSRISNDSSKCSIVLLYVYNRVKFVKL